MARDYTKEIEKRYAEEVRERKAKAGIQADASTTALKLFKHYVKRKPLVKEVTCTCWLSLLNYENSNSHLM